VIDNDHFKEKIDRDHDDVKNAQRENASVNEQQMFPFDPLHKTEHGKSKGDGDRDKTCPIRDRVQRHVHARQCVHVAVQRGKAYARSVGADRLHVN
jgi:hypothetical protein